MTVESASHWKDALRRKCISSVELLQHYLERVERLNAAFNIVVNLDLEGALEAARAADHARLQGRELGPLAGLPMTIKDSFEVVGMPTTCGMVELRDHRPRRDAEPVRRLRAAGAILFGKTNLPTGASDHQSSNALFGTTLNPWDRGRTVGGSSGGAAAALAAGMTPLELGSDIGGSIRIPAHFCGVFGHKTTHGIVPMRGHIPPMPGQSFEPELGVGGPLALTATDLELALDVIAGANEFDAAGWKLQLPPSRKADLRQFRVAVWLDAYPLDHEYEKALRAWIDDLRRLGVIVDEKARPALDPEEAHELYMSALYGVTRNNLAAEQREYLAATAPKYPADHYISRLARYACPSLAQWDDIHERRIDLFRTWAQFFASYELLICPVAQTVAFEHDHSGDGPFPRWFRTLMVNGKASPALDLLMWSGLATCSNLPATVMPIGRKVGSVPVGVQLIAPLYGDRTSLRFAQLAEQALGGFTAPSTRSVNP